MLFESAVSFFLIGLSATAVISLFAAIGTQGHPKHLTLPLHVVIAGIYLPLLAIGVNELPLTFITRPSTAWLVLVLVALSATCIHGLVVMWRREAVSNPETVDAGAIAELKTIIDKRPEGSQLGYILLNTGVSQYRETVLSAEEKGRDFAYIQRRIAPYFFTDEMLRFIAGQRFGAGNAEMNKYVSAHQRRRQAFFAALDSGARYREMFERRTLLRYVQTGTHAEEMWPLSPSTIVDLLKNWRQALLAHTNYYVGISTVPTLVEQNQLFAEMDQIGLFVC